MPEGLLPRLPPIEGPAWREYGLLAVTLLAVTLACTQPIWDPDTFWHLAAGREIWRTGHLLRTETFSFTNPAFPWEDTEWLFHAAAYPLWKLLGDGGLAVLTGLSGAGLALLIYRCVRVGGGNAAVFAVFMSLLLPGFQSRIRFRPDLLTLAFMALLCEWLFGRQAGKAPTVREALGLAAFFCLWAQCHGGWAYGLALLGATWAGECLDSLRARTFPWKLGASYFAAGLLLVAGLFLNPYGWRIPWFPIKSIIGFTDPNLTQIAEWEPTPLNLGFASFYLLCLLMGGFLLLGWRRTTWRELLSVTSQAALGFKWNRYVAVTIVALAAPFSRRISTLKARPAWIRAGWAMALVTALVALAVSFNLHPRGSDLSEKYPSQEAAFIRTNGLSGNLLNMYPAGGYLDWALYPQCRIFFDGRYYPFLKPMEDFRKAHYSVEAFGEFLAKYPIDIALYPTPDYFLKDPSAPPGSPGRGATVLLFPPSEWAPVFFGNYGPVLLKREPRFESFIDAHGYRHLRPDDLPFLIWSVRNGRLAAGDLAAEIRRALKENPKLVAGRATLARALAELESRR